MLSWRPGQSIQNLCLIEFIRLETTGLQAGIHGRRLGAPEVLAVRLPFLSCHIADLLDLPCTCVTC